MIKQNTRAKILAGLILVIVVLLLAVFLFSGENFDLLLSMFDKNCTNEELLEKLGDFGIKGYVTVSILSMLQVVFTFLPAEPAQVLAGLAFGFPFGIACCMVGVFLGNTAIYVLFKIFGNSIRDFFVKNLNVDLENGTSAARVTLIIFILYFLPAIPYGMICFMAASLGMKYRRYITVTLIGSFPSVCIGVVFGYLAGETSWIFSVIVVAVIVVLLLLLMFRREAMFKKINAFLSTPPYSSKTTVRSYSKFSLSVAYVISRIVFFFRGVRVRYVNKLGKDVDSPSIVLCNHGSFVDFAYAGTLIRKKTPNFIVARLYFYKKWVGNLLRRFGCFPKSMFAADLESAKNCLKVLRGGGVLAMMPEARLSTVGKFEDIQEGTYSFLKKAGVPIYTIKIHGDYLASPKWGNGIRRGSFVEAELDILLTAEELKSLSLEEIKSSVEERLYYNEFEWLKTKPKIRYRSRRLAEGLENILTRCPDCGARYSIRTKKRSVFCEKCGPIAKINNRYSFGTDAPFENFALWYDWQKEALFNEISENPDFALSSHVEFRLPSKDGKTMTRHAGEGVCTLNREGLKYEGTRDGEEVTLFFPIGEIYRLLFGAGENFEIYLGSEIHYFVPDEKRSAVDWYIASAILVDNARVAVPTL